MQDRLEIGEKPRLSHYHRGFEADEAGLEPDHPGETPRVRGEGNPSTRRWIVVPFLGRWAQPSRPGIGARPPERPRPVRAPKSPPKSLVHEASRCGASAGWLTAGRLKPPPRETPSTGLGDWQEFSYQQYGRVPTTLTHPF